MVGESTLSILEGIFPILSSKVEVQPIHVRSDAPYLYRLWEEIWMLDLPQGLKEILELCNLLHRLLHNNGFFLFRGLESVAIWRLHDP